MVTNKTDLQRAAKVAEEMKAELNYYRHRVYHDMLVHGNALMETAAKATATLTDLPPVNPDMVPIPEVVHDIIEQEENAPPAGYPTTPVYVVQQLGKGFVPDSEFFEPRVGPGGSKMADFIIERKGTPKMQKMFKQLKAAKDHDAKAEKDMKGFKAIINQSLKDAPASPEVEADLKPTLKQD